MDEKRILYIAAIAAFIVPFSNTIYNPNIAVIQEDFGTSYTLIAATISAYTLMMALSQLIHGPLSDRFGRKRILLPGLIVYIIANILMYFSWDVYSLIAFRVLQAIGVSTTVVVGAAVISDIFPRERRGRAMGTYTFVLLVGPTIGPVVGGVLADAFGWRSIFIFLTIVGSLMALVVYKLLPETLQKPHKSHALAALALLKDSKTAATCLLGAAVFASIYIFATFLPIVFHESYGLSSTYIGLAFLLSGIMLLAGTFIGGRLSDKIDRKKVFISGAFIAFISVLLSAFWADALYPLIAAYALFGFGTGLFFPAARVYVIEIGR